MAVSSTHRLSAAARHDTARVLAFLGAHAVPGVETWDGANAEPAAAKDRMAQAVSPDAPPPRRRPRLRVYPQAEPDGVYPRYNPGPDAVRQCNATYVQEFRPSGTVIVLRRPRLVVPATRSGL